MNNWRDISCLNSGNEKQKRAYQVLTEHNVLELIAEYDPVLVSTVCVGLDIECSDLDIICQNHDSIEYIKKIQEYFSEYDDFKFWTRLKDESEIVASFVIDEFEIEIFSCARPSSEQYGYRHLNVMHKLLTIGGDLLRDEIKELKLSGMKTEPAFAKRLNLEGDPYKAFLELENYSTEQLKLLIDQ